MAGGAISRREGARRAHRARAWGGHKRPLLLFVLLALLASSGLLGGCTSAGGSAEQVRLVVTPVATPTATVPAAATVPPVTYTVKPGDTLSGIADMFGVTVDDIVRSNNIADPNSLSVGQVLTIPGRAPATATPAPAQTGTPGTPGTPVSTEVVPTSVATGTVTVAPGPNLSPVLPPPDVTPPQGPTPDSTTP